MNPVKLKARATELKDAIESGDCETIDGVYTPAERKEIKKRWPLLWDLLQNIEEQLSVVADAQDDLLNQVEMLELVAEARAIVDQRDFDAPEFDPPRDDDEDGDGDDDAADAPTEEIEVVDAVPITEGE
jgi:hypothetical protein